MVCFYSVYLLIMYFNPRIEKWLYKVTKTRCPEFKSQLHEKNGKVSYNPLATEDQEEEDNKKKKEEADKQNQDSDKKQDDQKAAEKTANKDSDVDEDGEGENEDDESNYHSQNNQRETAIRKGTVEKSPPLFNVKYIFLTNQIKPNLNASSIRQK